MVMELKKPECKGNYTLQLKGGCDGCYDATSIAYLIKDS